MTDCAIDIRCCIWALLRRDTLNWHYNNITANRFCSDWQICISHGIRVAARAFMTFVEGRSKCLLLHCALASGAVYCNRSCLCVCVCGGRAVSEPYYSQHARCLRLSGRFFHYYTIYLHCSSQTWHCVLLIMLHFSLWFSIIQREHFYARPIGGGIKQWCWRLTSVCLSRTSWIWRPQLLEAKRAGRRRCKACMGWSWAAPCAGAGVYSAASHTACFICHRK